ncbi:MAG: hydrogenase expression/formation protein, partial [Promethearchaeota archaeon]
MKRSNEKFALGKLKHDYLAHLLSEIELKDSRVIMGSKIGEDAAVIDIPGENNLVVKTDPITFTTDEIGYYAVIVNVNDVVCTGAKPKWFQSTILLPENHTTHNMIDQI